jgi:hypothetical protein
MHGNAARLRLRSLLPFSIVCFILAPSKGAAIGYALLLGFCLVVIIVGISLIAWLIGIVKDGVKRGSGK